MYNPLGIRGLFCGELHLYFTHTVYLAVKMYQSYFLKMAF
jgi:hypothetical protein